MEGVIFALAYLDDLLYLFVGKFSEHLVDVEAIPVYKCKANLKVDIVKSSFGKTESDYLGYVISQEDIKP